MEPTSTPQPFNADIAGRTYSATWRIDRKSVRVECAYGTGLAVLRPGADALAVARRILQKIVGAGRRTT